MFPTEFKILPWNQKVLPVELKDYQWNSKCQQWNSNIISGIKILPTELEFFARGIKNVANRIQNISME